jgi:hypothetical protein
MCDRRLSSSEIQYYPVSKVSHSRHVEQATEYSTTRYYPVNQMRVKDGIIMRKWQSLSDT